MDESTIIQSAQAGSLAAFNRLVMQYQGLAYSVAYRVLGNSQAAEDATQEAFIKAYKSLAQYRGGSFKSWLMRIVTNTCYDQIRYHKRRPTEPLEPEDPDFESDHNPSLIADQEQPEDVALRHELSDLLQNVINMLPEDQRLVLILSDVEGMNYQEIADIADVALGTVKSRLSRARRKMRQVLQEQELLPQLYRHATKGGSE
jgi:RNA polymerase sigma-70 factor (ECF subfamily)